MAVPIKPKSKARISHSIKHSYGEIPATKDDQGRPCWVLPGNRIVYTEEEALHWAKVIDNQIRANLRRNPSRRLI